MLVNERAEAKGTREAHKPTETTDNTDKWTHVDVCVMAATVFLLN